MSPFRKLLYSKIKIIVNDLGISCGGPKLLITEDPNDLFDDFDDLFGFVAFDHFLVDGLEGEALTCRVDLAVGQSEGFGSFFV